MERTPVNPWPWSLGFAYNQAEPIEGAHRLLVCSGQTATDAAGRPQHPGDMAAQLTMALDNLEAVLAAAGMALAGVRPPSTLLGVARLAAPELLVELEATAMA